MPKKVKSRMGRPPLPKGEKKRHVIPFKIDDGDLKAIDRTARELGISRSELIRRAVMGVVRRRGSLSRGVGGGLSLNVNTGLSDFFFSKFWSGSTSRLPRELDLGSADVCFQPNASRVWPRHLHNDCERENSHTRKNLRLNEHGGGHSVRAYRCDQCVRFLLSYHKYDRITDTLCQIW